MQGTGAARLTGAGVTAREAETLAAIGRRLTNREIAAEMFISVRTVESHVSALLRKLGLPGRPALVELARQLPGGPALPVPVTSFVGRGQDLTELARLLGTCRFISLVGPAGCGKTRLAAEAARQWPGETRIADLSGAAGADAVTVIAAALGIGDPAGDLAAAARVALARRKVLLVADNCEHAVATAGPVLGALTRAVPSLRVLATSREPLGTSEEHVHPVPPLGLPAGPQLTDVQASAAGQLFLDRAAAAPDFRLDAASAPHVAAICARLDGLPLALELAAGRLRHLGAEQLASDLEHTPGDLERPAPAARHQSLASAIGWSWQLLSGPERDLLSRLALLPGEFTLALAGTAAAPPGGPDPRPLLLRLADQSLVSMRLPERGPARYGLLRVIRAFALAHATPEAAAQVPRAHARFCRDAAARAIAARPDPAQAGPPDAGLDEPNLLAALAWSTGNDPGLADDLLRAVCQLTEAEPTRRALEAIRAAAASSVPGWSSEALARAGLAVTYLSLGDAGLLASRSRLAARTERDTAWANWATGWVHAYLGDRPEAVRCLDLAISYARPAGDRWLEGAALQGRGRAQAGSREAFADWEQAITCFVLAGDLLNASNVRYMLAGRAVEAQVRLPEVPVWLDACEAYAASHGYQHEGAHIQLVRASYLRICGQPGQARDLLDAALPVFRHAGDFRCIARALLELAQPAITGDPPAAADLLLQSLPAAAIAGDPDMCRRVLTGLTEAATAAGDLVLAARCRGALGTVGPPAGAAPGPASDPPGDAYATFAGEGATGGIALITALYPR